MAQIFGSISNFLSGGQFGQARSAMQAATAALAATMPPALTNLIPQLQYAVATGELTPAEAQAQIQQASAQAGVQVPEELVETQMGALNQLREIATSGGLTDMDKAQLEEIRTQIGQQVQGQQQAVMQNMQERGLGGSGMELAAKLQATQAGADRAARMGTDVAAQAQQRALAAIAQSGQMAGQIRGQSVQEQQVKAEAADRINAFNAQMAQQAALANQQARQQTNLTKFNRAQELENQRVATANQAAMMPFNAAQQEFENRLGLNRAISNTFVNRANLAQTQGEQTKKMVTGAITAAAGAMSDERTKEDIGQLTDDDVDNILGKLTGYRYRYKNGTPGNDGREHVGIMAQDLEKTPMSEDVIDTPEGKVVVDNDKDKLIQLAVLSNLHKRMKQLEHGE